MYKVKENIYATHKDIKNRAVYQEGSCQSNKKYKANWLYFWFKYDLL